MNAVSILNPITNYLSDRRHRRDFLALRSTLADIHTLLFPESETTGALVRMKTGIRLSQYLENRLGLQGPDFGNPVTSDSDLEREANLLDKLAPEQLAKLSIEFGRRAERVLLERGDPQSWEDGEDTKNVASLIALRLLSGWLKCKFIAHTSTNRAIILDAREHEELHYSHLQRLLRLFRGEAAISENET